MVGGARRLVRSLASFDFRMPRWPSVALFFWVRLIWGGKGAWGVALRREKGVRSVRVQVREG